MAKQKSGRSRGQIIPKGENKWLIRVFVGRDAAGKRKYNSETVAGTKAEAELRLDKLNVGTAEGTVVAKTKRTVKEHLENFLDTRVDISPKTLMDYKHRAEKDIYPFIGRLALTSITKEILQALVSKLQKERELSPRTIKYSMTVLGQAINDACDSGLMAKNPMRFVKLPKDDHREPTVHTPDQMQSFLARTATGDVLRHALYTLMLTAGLRPQELCALKWDDIVETEQGATITVVRALKKIAKSKWEVGEVKTKKGRRSIPVPKETYSALQAHKRAQNALMLRLGTRYQRLGYVFASRKRNPGAFLDIATVRRWWKMDLAAAELPVLKLYTARHNHITALLASGIHPKVAQERAGHSSIRVTMDTYSHVLPGMQQQASDEIGGMLFKRAAV